MILQHPRESDVPINTARLAELQLEGAERYVGTTLAELPGLRQRLQDPTAPAILLYPGEGARDLHAEPPAGPVTLLVIDGTWWQARKLFRNNPELAALPRFSLTPNAPSRYRIRREPAAHCVSTIEAIGEALSVLEPSGFDRTALLRPFEAMVDYQLHYAEAQASRRHLTHRARKLERPPRPPALLLEREADLVVAYGEANAWAKGSPLGGDAEIVHWTAERVSSGERFEALIKPRRALSPSFEAHARVDPARVLDGESFDTFRERWAMFARPRDVLVGWGFYAAERLRAEGIELPERVDLRLMSRRHLRRKTGEVAECASRLGAAPEEPWALGRAGVRLSAAVAVTRALLAAGRA